MIWQCACLLFILTSAANAQEQDTAEEKDSTKVTESDSKPDEPTKKAEASKEADSKSENAETDENVEPPKARDESGAAPASASSSDEEPSQTDEADQALPIGEDRFADTPELKDFRSEVRAFEAEYTDIRTDIKRLVEYQRERRLLEVEAQFKRVIEDLTARERERRADAIAQFERFVKRYPSEPKFTPSALLRLAQLHYERSEDIFFLETEKYDQQMNLFESADAEQAPEEPVVNYTRTIELFAQLIRDWPDSKMLDGAYYMQGYCLSAMQKEEEALKNFKLLVQRFPESTFRQEAWWRIGEYYFDSNLLAESIEAYKKVFVYKEGRFYF